MQKLSNEKYLGKVLGEAKMDTLARVVALEYSSEALAELREIAQEFLDREQPQFQSQSEELQQKQREIKALRREISEKEDLRDKLTIVG